jgi:hypothetical protein
VRSRRSKNPNTEKKKEFFNEQCFQKELNFKVLVSAFIAVLHLTVTVTISIMNIADTPFSIISDTNIFDDNDYATTGRKLIDIHFLDNNRKILY